MTKTKEIIRELLEHHNIDEWKYLSRSERTGCIISQFGCSYGVAVNVSNHLSTYSEDCLFNIYFPELF